MTRLGLSIVILTSLLFLGPPSARCDAGDDQVDYTNLSIEELMDIEVTSVSRRPEKLSEAPAAVFVITQEDIRRSGATSIPELLRMVPGVQVASIDASKWAITARGFNGRFANKLLVLVDGRSVYTPLYSGVFWDVQDMLLADVDRIEVIRGPGATMWGENAVNGVINVITKSARDTQGGLVMAGGGKEEIGLAGFRYGGAVRDRLYWRGFAKYSERDKRIFGTGQEAADDWGLGYGGLRLDWYLSDDDVVNLQGHRYDGEAGQTYTTTVYEEGPAQVAVDYRTEVSGGNVLGRWEHRFSESSDIALQMYYDRDRRQDVVLTAAANKFNIDFDHRFALGRRNDVLWGLGYRLTSDKVIGSPGTTIVPERRDIELASAFVQDDVTLVGNRLRLVVGSKFEINDFTGFEVQPSARLLWTPHPQHGVWAAVSRAIRTPSRGEVDARLVQPTAPSDPYQPGAPLTVILVEGNEDLDSEKLTAYELGYRTWRGPQVSVDVVAFYNVYDELITAETGDPIFDDLQSPQVITLPVSPDNKMTGTTYGLEVDADWQVKMWWLVRCSYSYLHMDLETNSDSNDPHADWATGESPRHQFGLSSSVDVPGGLELDVGFRFVDDLPTLGIDGYSSLTTRVGWSINENLRASVVGQNLLDGSHVEFEQDIIETLPTAVERSGYAMVTWAF